MQFNKENRFHAKLIIMTLITLLFTSINAESCVVKDDICDCSNTFTKGLDCPGATSLVIKNNTGSASNNNWTTGLNIVKTGIKNVTLTNNKLQEIPIQLLPDDLEVLNISNNKIENIRPYQLSRFTKLKVLDISNNLFSNFNSEAFAGLCNLEELYLKRNYLDDLRNVTRALKNTPFLKVLDLSENIFEEVFVPVLLKNLQVLNFEGNMISNVSITRCTYNLPNLKRLNFEKNELRSFPRSIIDSLQDTEILLKNNPLLCDCSVLGPLVNFNNTYGFTCTQEGITYNMTARNPECMMDNTKLPRQTNSSSLVLSSGNDFGMRSCSNEAYRYCSELFRNGLVDGKCDDTTEICWDLPEDVCDEVHNLVKVTDGGLDLSMARHFNLNGVYTYKEYHTCNEVRLYTITGHIDLKVTSEQTPSEKRQNCAVRKRSCDNDDNNSDNISAWKLALIVTIPCICLIAIIGLVYVKTNTSIPKTKKKLTEHTFQYPNPHYVVDSVSPVKVSHVVRNGYLTIRNENDTPENLTHIYDNAFNTYEVEAQGYEPLAVDDYGYLLMASPTTARQTNRPTPSTGYYLLLPDGSANEIMVGEDGYLSVNQSVNVTEDADGYVCMTLKRDQGDLGQLVTDQNLYIKLERVPGEDVHIYEKLQSAWKLLRFWQGKEEENIK